ncbi:MAG: stage II sporulation protein R [Oscillospiraceae bacterium]|nr:stage II sporulation protein R [Oscillospiraceae bacterium]
MLVHEKKERLRHWEAALLFGLGFALLTAVWIGAQQRTLAGRMVRLHVVAASDSAEDQAVKLLVRDAVLDEAAPWLEGAATQEEAMAVLAEHLDELARVGAEAAGGEVQVTASLEKDTWFPTKEYTDFALPAGRYAALKITLGEGQGKNWWCVVFPPLCLGSVSETVAERAGNFSDGQVKLITGENEGYVVKFKAMELWDEFSDWMEGGTKNG